MRERERERIWSEKENSWKGEKLLDLLIHGIQRPDTILNHSLDKQTTRQTDRQTDKIDEIDRYIDIYIKR